MVHDGPVHRTGAATTTPTFNSLPMMVIMSRALLLSAVPVAAATPCPAGLTQLESFGYPEEDSSTTYTACEDLSHSDGDLLLLPAAGAPIRFPKRLDSMFQAINTSFAGTSEGMKSPWPP